MVTRGDVIREGAFIATVVELSETAPDEEMTAFGALCPGVYAGPPLRRALRLARAAANSDLPMVIVGETGTGKERVARLFTNGAGARATLWPSTAPPSPMRWPKASCSAFAKAPSPAPSNLTVGCFAWPSGGRCCWTK